MSLLVLSSAGFSCWLEPFASAEEPSPDGLVLWLDASDVNGDGRSQNEPLTGSRLSVWMDKSGSENHVRQDAAVHQPNLITNALAGQPAVRFAESSLQRARVSSGFSSLL